MSRVVNGIILVSSLVAVSLLTGCGVTSTTLPSNLQPSASNSSLSITMTQLANASGGFFLPDGVAGRSYNLSISTSATAGTLYTCSILTGTLPSGLSASSLQVDPAGQNCVLSGTIASSAAGKYPVTIQATDNGSPAHTAQLAFTLSVRPEISITQTSLAPAVHNRMYGTGPGCTGGATCVQNVTTNLVTPPTPASGQTTTPGQSTAGNGPLTGCYSSGLPSGIMVVGSGNQCQLATVTGGTVSAAPPSGSKCTAPGFASISGTTSVALPATSGGNVTVCVTDTPITFGSQTVVPAGDVALTLPLTVNPQIQLAQSLGTTWPDAVNGRTYGTGSGCSGGACASGVYTATGGLAAVGGYVWATSGSANNLQSLGNTSCSTSTASNSNDTQTCNSTKITAGSSKPGDVSSTLSPTMTVTDVANTATPAATTTSDPQSTRTDTLVVDAPLGGTQSPAALAPAVTGRDFAVNSDTCAGGAKCAPLAYALAGGLKKYTWPTPNTVTGVSGFACTASQTTNPGDTNTCSAVSLPAPSGNYPGLTITASDVANATTPNGSYAFPTATLTVNAALSGAQSPVSLAPAVAGRDFAVNTDTCTGGAKCVPLVYSVAGGLLSYSWPSPNTLSGVSGFACTPSQTANPGDTNTCSAANLSAPAGNYSNVTITASDVANTQTPSGNYAFPNTSLTVNAALAGTQTPAALPQGVTGRDYGVSTDSCLGGAKCAPIVYKAAGGLLSYTWPATNTVSGITGFVCTATQTTNPGDTDSCSATALSAAVSGATPYNVTITESDVANTQTPSGQYSFPASPLTVNAALGGTQSPTALAPAVTGRDFGVKADTCAGGAKCAPLAYTATGGLLNYTWPTPNTVSGVTGFTCAPSQTTNPGDTDTCSAINLAAPAGNYPGVTITASDVANTAVPSSSYAFPNASLTVNAALGGTQSPVALAPGVTGRDFGVNTDTCQGAAKCAPLVYTVTGGLLNYTWPTPNTVSGVSGFACTPSQTANPGDTDSCAAANLSAGQGTYNAVTITASDVANTQTPSGNYPFPNTSLTVNAALGGAQTPASLPQGVTGRDYGINTDTCASGAKCVPIAFKATGGLLNYTWPATNTVSGITGFTCTSSQTSNPGDTDSCAATTLSAAASATAYNVTITESDVANAQTPSGQFPFPASPLTVNAALGGTQSPVSLATAVTGRDFGVNTDTCASGVKCAPLVYTATGGLLNYTWPTPNTVLGVTGFSCTPTQTTNPGDTDTCSALNLSASAGNYPGVTITASDVANTTTPSSSYAFPTTSLTVNAALNGSQSPAALAPAVTGRDFGVKADTCAGAAKCVPLVYTATGGLLSYTWPTPNTLSGVSGFACTPSQTTNPGDTDTCSAANLSAAMGSYNSVTITESDVANTQTPSGKYPFPNTSLTVNAALGGTQTPAVLPQGVTGRDYGVNADTCVGVAKCVPIVYKATGGLLSFTWPTPTNTVTGITGFTCTSSQTTNPGDTDSCSAAALSAAASATAYNVTITESDLANTQTPSGQFPFPASPLTVNAALGGTQNPASLATAVSGRDFGVNTDTCASGVKCAPLVYTATGGLLNYTWPTPNTVAGITGFTCTASQTTNPGDTDSCSATNLSAAAGSYPNLTITASDVPNTAVPSSSFPFPNTTLNVNAALALNSPASYPDAENDVTYGTAAAGCTPTAQCAALVYQVPFVSSTIDGLPPYTFSNSGFPTNLDCTQSSAGGGAPAGTVYTCDAASAISAPGPFPEAFSPSVQVADTANASAPSLTVLSPAANLNVQAQLSILDTALPNGLVGFVYNPSGPGVTIKSMGGIGLTTWVGPGDGASGACLAPTAATLPGTTTMTFNDATQLFSTGGANFAAGDVSAADGAYTFQVCVTDTGNAATPQSAALPNPNPPASSHLTQNQFVFDVLNTFAYTPELTTKAIDVVNTTGIAVVGSGISLGGTAPTANPNGVAITPDGTRAFVTLSNNTVAVIDTITNAQVSGSPYAVPAGSTCMSMAGIALTNDNRAYIACPTSSATGATGVVDVVNTSTGALVAELATNGAPMGVAVSPTVDPTGGQTAQVYVTLSATNQLVVITNSSTPAVAADVSLTTTNGSPLGLAAVANPSGDVYVYIAKNAAGAGNPGIDIVDAKTGTLSSIAFALATQQPVGVAVTPDGTQVYVTLTDTAGPSGEVWVVDNTNPPVSRVGSPFSLPAPNAAATNTGPVGVTIPPLSTVPTPAGFSVYIAQSAAFNLDVLNDNPYTAVLALGNGDGTTTTFASSFPTVPIADSVEVLATVGGAPVIGFDNGTGTITGTGISAGTVDHTTGAVSVTFTTAPDSGTAITAFIIPSSATTIALTPTNPAPQGIASIPLPAVFPALP